MQKCFRPVSLALCALVLSGCHRSPGRDVAAEINGRPITYSELEKTYAAQFLGSAKAPADEQTEFQKLEVLRTLIDNEIILQRAEKEGLMATDSEVDTRFNEIKGLHTKEEFNAQLKTRNITAEDFKAQIRRDLSIRKLINKEITSKINITDAEVSQFYTENKKSFNLPEPQIHMAQIVVTTTPDPNVHNIKSDKAQNAEQAAKKIQAIEVRLKEGEDFGILAQNYSEDPATIPNGGDMGTLPESAFEKTSPELRKLVFSMQPGQISPILNTQDSYRILKLISKEPAGQRDLTDPRVQQSIRETLLNRKDQLLRSAYYEVARGEAKVQNYYARSVLDNAGKSAR